MKRVIFFILFLLLTFNINSMVIHGQLDDGFILEENSSQHLFFIGLDTMAFNHIHSNTVTDFSVEEEKINNNINAIFMPFYFGFFFDKRNDYSFLLAGSPLMILPFLSLGYIARFHINSKTEINFNTFISSPKPDSFIIFLAPINFSYYLPAIYGVGGFIGIGFKRKISKNEKSSLSYKINFGIEYTGDMFFGLDLKNSILIGIKRKNSILSLNPFINFELKCLAPNDFLIIALEPGFELTLKLATKNNFVFISSFMIGYESDFLIDRENAINKKEYFLYSGKIVISASFGLGGIVIKN
ncbi:MAG TPA: hypothetical protein PLE45_09800 [Spirochaetota bacterium]|nr:hypothetical protein [Spirochaetota bacterium]HOL57393.1 hypothetical protein [Spirochaetota bacterium]HPP04915.1 hypothetical protein [Spirochaetota bacterium]